MRETPFRRPAQHRQTFFSVALYAHVSHKSHSQYNINAQKAIKVPNLSASSCLSPWYHPERGSIARRGAARRSCRAVQSSKNAPHKAGRQRSRCSRQLRPAQIKSVHPTKSGVGCLGRLVAEISHPESNRQPVDPKQLQSIYLCPVLEMPSPLAKPLFLGYKFKVCKECNPEVILASLRNLLVSVFKRHFVVI